MKTKLFKCEKCNMKFTEEKHVKALKIIQEKGGKITKKEMAELADNDKLITVNAEKENYNQVRFASLDQNIIQPLKEKWNFIDVEKIGRTRWVKLNQNGENVTKFL